MKDKFVTWADAALTKSPIQTFFHWRAARQLTVLAYHGIDDPHCFESQLDYLVEVMHPVTLDEVVKVIAGHGSLPKRAVLVTFDDGDRSLVEVGLPLLRSRGIPAVAFVIAGLLDTTTPFWWVEAEALARAGGTARNFLGLPPPELVRRLKQVPDDQRLAALAELRQTASMSPLIMSQLRRTELALLESAGITIGNHTFSHPCLPNCSDGKIMSELSLAHQVLTAALGHAPRAFAYPNGDADDRVIQGLTRLDYEIAFLFDHRLSSIPSCHPFRISRVRVNSNTSLDRFRLIVSGFHPALYHVRNGRHN